MPKNVTETHQELMHYTTSAGLQGIVTSGCVWATHSGALNDSQEIIHFLDNRLVDIIQEEAATYLRELSTEPENVDAIEAKGGFNKLLDEQTAAVAKIFRDTTLSFHQPYIFSLSAIASERTGKNGLLSQWRGYGTDGGYAIVFEADKFEKLLIEEVDTHFYQHLQWGDVYYYGLPETEQRASEEIQEAEEKLRASLRKIQRNPEPTSMEDSYHPMILLSCMYKHWGFHEEQEVRVVAIPPNEDIMKLARDKGEEREARGISTVPRGGMLVPYLELFNHGTPSTRKLPIKRVIVGPHPLSATRKKTVEMLLKSHGYDAEVIVSEIPYLGR